MGRGDGGNGFDILVGRREKRRNVGIEVMEKDGMKKKKAPPLTRGAELERCRSTYLEQERER